MHKNFTNVLARFEQETILHSADLKPLEKFRELCRRNQIGVVEDGPMEHVKGFYIPNWKGHKMIVLKKDLEESHREFVAFHELGHHFFGADENTANFFAFLALSTA